MFGNGNGNGMGEGKGMERRGDLGVVGKESCGMMMYICVRCQVYVISVLGFGVQIKVSPQLLPIFPSSGL